jgi:T-complex protein 1 subunit eta
VVTCSLFFFNIRYAAATEAACVILSIDETVRNAQSEQPGAAAGGLTMQQQQAKMKAAMGRGGGGRGVQPVRRMK